MSAAEAEQKYHVEGFGAINRAEEKYPIEGFGAVNRAEEKYLAEPDPRMHSQIHQLLHQIRRPNLRPDMRRSFVVEIEDGVAIRCVENIENIGANHTGYLELSVQLDEYDPFVGRQPYSAAAGFDFDRFRQLVRNPDTVLDLGSVEHTEFQTPSATSPGAFIEYVVFTITTPDPDADAADDEPEMTIYLTRELTYDLVSRIRRDLIATRRVIRRLVARLAP